MIDKIKKDFGNKAAVKLSDRENMLVESFRVLNSDLDLDAVIKNSLGILLKRFNAEAACLFLADLHDYKLKSCCMGSSSPDRVYILPLDNENQIAGWDVASREPVLMQDIDRDNEFAKTIKKHLGIIPHSIIGMPLFASGEFFGVIQAINSENSEKFLERDLELMEVLVERIALTLRNAWMLQEAIRASDEARSLYEIGIALSGSLELDGLLDKILENLARVIDCDIGMVYLVDPDNGTINQIATRGISDISTEEISLKIGQGICGRVAETGEGIIVSDVYKNEDYIACRFNTKSEMAVPLKTQNAIVGVLNVESDNPNAYKNHELELLSAFGSLAAVSIERAKLHRKIMSAERLENEILIARRIQKTFLPAGDPAIDGFDVAGINISSAEVGGDYYDFIPIVENQLGIAIGDVSGKGIPASLIMAAFRASLKAEIRNNFAIRTVLQKVNNLLYESIDRAHFVTAAYCVLDSKNKILTFSNAGHNHPILVRSTNEIQFLKEGGFPLGIFTGSTYEESSVILNSGDILLFYTDGVTEVRNKKGEEFGEKRVIDSLISSKDKSAREIIDILIEKTKKFGLNSLGDDDLTLIALKAL